MQFELKKCNIEGLFEIQPKIIGDSRGYFFESYNKKDFFDAGLTMNFVQDNQSASTKGVLRGLHFQKKHPQGKLVRAMQGKVYDVAVDLRDGSKTFGKYYGVILDSEKQNEFYIPEGFAHGFYVLTEAAIFTYKCTDFYHPEDDAGIIWNDKNINVNWQEVSKDFNEANVNLSEKDKKLPNFDRTTKYFSKDGVWIGN